MLLRALVKSLRKEMEAVESKSLPLTQLSTLMKETTLFLSKGKCSSTHSLAPMLLNSEAANETKIKVRLGRHPYAVMVLLMEVARSMRTAVPAEAPVAPNPHELRLLPMITYLKKVGKFNQVLPNCKL